jgi:hypothetical protein
MTTRTTRSAVTFQSPFRVKGMSEQQPAGTYEIETDEEAIEWNDRTVYRRVATLLILKDTGQTRTVTIDPMSLEAALADDRAQVASDELLIQEKLGSYSVSCRPCRLYGFAHQY